MLVKSCYFYLSIHRNNRIKMERDLDNILAACKNSLLPSSGDTPGISSSFSNSNNTVNNTLYTANSSNNAALFDINNDKNVYRSASDVTKTAISSSNSLSMYSNSNSSNMSGSDIISSTGNVNANDSAYVAAGFSNSTSSITTTTTTAATTTSCSTTTTSYSNSTNNNGSISGGSLSMTAARQRRASEYGYAQALLSQAPKIAAGVGGGALGSSSDLDPASVLRLAQAFVTLQQGKTIGRNCSRSRCFKESALYISRLDCLFGWLRNC